MFFHNRRCQQKNCGSNQSVNLQPKTAEGIHQVPKEQKGEEVDEDEEEEKKNKNKEKNYIHEQIRKLKNQCKRNYLRNYNYFFLFELYVLCSFTPWIEVESFSTPASSVMGLNNCTSRNCLNGDCVEGYCICRQGWQGSNCQYCAGKIR